MLPSAEIYSRNISLRIPEGFIIQALRDLSGIVARRMTGKRGHTIRSLTAFPSVGNSLKISGAGSMRVTSVDVYCNPFPDFKKAWPSSARYVNRVMQRAEDNLAACAGIGNACKNLYPPGDADER